jgi:putative DeoR family transcriptional regulator (stage III sporulation protein D)
LSFYGFKASYPLIVPHIYVSTQIFEGARYVKGIVEERAVELGEYIIEHKATVRGAAKKFGISKSTVHKDVSERLKKLNPQLYIEVKHILDVNKAQRHIRGGLATRRKYRHE